MRTLCCAALLSIFVAGCSGSNTNAAAGAAGQTAAGAAQGAAAQTGQSLGIKDSLVQVAMEAAKSFLSKQQNPTPADKEAAAKQGVDAAAAKAKEEGQELNPTQQTGLMDMLKNAL